MLDKLSVAFLIRLSIFTFYFHVLTIRESLA